MDRHNIFQKIIKFSKLIKYVHLHSGNLEPPNIIQRILVIVTDFDYIASIENL